MSLALLIATLVATAIGTIPGIPSTMATAIQAIVGTLGVITKNGLGTTSPTTVSVILATLSGVIAELKTIPGLSSTALNDVAVLEDALAAALAQQTATTSIDPTKLQPITPIP